MRQNSPGQTLLVILLIMAVALTIGLSVVSRSITDIRISQEQEESARAFSAAEAGLESLLSTGGAPGIVGDFKITTDTRNLGDSNTFIFPKEIAAGDSQTVWLVGHNSDGDPDPGVDQFSKPPADRLEIFWGNEGTPENQDDTPALEATIFYKSGDSFETIKYTSEPNSSRAASNNFSTDRLAIGAFSLDNKTFRFRRRIPDLPTNMYVLRLKLIYNDGTDHILGVRGVGDTLPLQGNCYASTATSETTGISRKVEQCQFYSSLSGMFDYVLYSGSSL